MNKKNIIYNLNTIYVCIHFQNSIFVFVFVVLSHLIQTINNNIITCTYKHYSNN